MLYDGIQLLGSSAASNFTIESGSTLPTTGNTLGELFYKTGDTLYVYDGSQWSKVAGGPSLQLGGQNTEVQFNDNGVLGGSTALTFNKNTGKLSATSFAGVGSDLTALNGSNISSGTIAPARLGTGTANSTTYLRGDGTWATVMGSVPGGSNTQLQYNNNGAFAGMTGVTWDSTNGVIKMGTPLSTTPSGVRLHLTNSANGDGIVQGIRIEGNGENYFDVGRSAGDTTSAAFIIRGNQQISASSPVFAIRQYNTEQFRVNFSGAVSFGSSEANFGSAGQFLVSNGSGTAPSWTSNLNASNLSSGTVPTARLGTGTADNTTYLRGDGTWATVTGGSGAPGGATTQVQYNNAGAFAGSGNFTWNNTDGRLLIGAAATTANSSQKFQVTSTGTGTQADLAGYGSTIAAGTAPFNGGTAGIIQGIRLEGNSSAYFDIGRSGGGSDSGAIVIQGSQGAVANYLSFRMGNGEKIRMGDSGLWVSRSVLPMSDNTLDLGSGTYRWKTVTATAFSGDGALLSNLNATNLASGTVGTARLGSGTANSTTYLRGDGTWAVPTATATTLSATASLTVNGATTGIFGYVTSSRPYFTFVNTNSPAGAQVSDFTVSNTDGSLNWRLVADGNGVAANWMTVTRSGNTASNVTIAATAITLNGAVTGTSFSGSGASLTNLNASNLASGTVPTARLGSGTANSTTYLRGDGTWATVSAGSATTLAATGTLPAYTGTTGLYAGVAGTNVWTMFTNLNAAAGNRIGGFWTDNSGSLRYDLVNDGGSGQATVFKIDRSANTATNITLTSTAITLAGAVTANSLSTSGALTVTGSTAVAFQNAGSPTATTTGSYFYKDGNGLPVFAMAYGPATTDNHTTRMHVNSDGSFAIAAVNDANSAYTEWMRVSRSNTTVTEVKLAATAITLNGAVTSNTSFIAPLYSGTNAATGGNITVRGGNGSAGNGGTLTLAGGTATGTAGSVTIQTAGTTRLTVDATGAWLVGGSAGTANYVLSSNGAGAAPTWKVATAVVMNATGTVAMPVITTSSINAGINNGTGAPQMLFTNSGAAADTKSWYWNLDSSGTLSLNTLNDANSSGTSVISLARTGTTVNSITLSATDVIMAGATFNTNVKVGTRASAAASGSMLYGSNGTGNFHIDSANAMFLNYWAGTGGVFFGNGAGASSGASVSSAGLVTAKTLSVTSGVTTVFFPTTDNSIALGGGSNRWSVVYAGTGTINTSDGNLKQDVAELDEVEKRVALRLKALIRKFRFKDAVAEKGADARIHVGAIAQDVEAAFILEGLNPEHYAVFCKDTWIDEDHVEHTRLGIRYDEMFAFIISIL